MAFTLTFFSFTFFNKFDGTYKFFPCQKGNIFSQIFWENCAFYGLDKEPEPELKIGTGTCQKSGPELVISRNRKR
jgi:hypothetical protein